MSSGLLALLDDVVALAKLTATTLDDATSQAASVSAKSAGILIDDAAVTPRYVVGLASERELPIVGRIALGSLKNKLLFLLPIALLLTAVAPWAVTPILMLGGIYLCLEGYEKVHDLVWPDSADAAATKKASRFASAKALEDAKVASAIRTDLILSAEIMALALASIVEPNLLVIALVLAVVGVLVTAGVYGTVALIVKADDFGLYLAQKQNAFARAIGCRLVRGMPPFLKALATVGTVAMLWVGGGILTHGLDTFGISGPEHAIRGLEVAARDLVPAMGTMMGWLAKAAGSAIFGLIAGALSALALAPFTAIAERVGSKSE